MDNPPEDLKVLAGQLRSYKGWLTQSIRSCNNLVDLPHTVANASYLMSKMQEALDLLDVRKSKIENCLLEMEELEAGKERDDRRKERETYYDTTRDEITTRYETCYNAVMEALSNLNTTPDLNVTAPPEHNNQGGENKGFKSCESLRPPVLTKENSPQEFANWQKMFKAFYSASNIGSLKTCAQHAFVRRSVDSDLMSVLETQITATTPIFDDENMPGTDSVFSLLNKEFLYRYPLVSRRFSFFSLNQARGQSFTEYLAKLTSLGNLAELNTLSMEDLFVYRAIVGLGQEYNDLREKLLELETLNMKEVRRCSRAYESAQSVINRMKSTSYSFANLAISDDQGLSDNDAHVNQISAAAQRKWLQLRREGRCPRCALDNPSHSPQQCGARQRQCNGCGSLGHL